MTAYWHKVDIKPNDVKQLMTNGSIVIDGTKITLLSRKLIPPTRIDEEWNKFW